MITYFEKYKTPKTKNNVNEILKINKSKKDEKKEIIVKKKLNYDLKEKDIKKLEIFSGKIKKYIEKKSN
jgi:hypothetical protein